MIEVELLRELLIYSVLLGFVTMGLNEVLKKTITSLRSSLLPFTAIIIGGLLGLVTGFAVPDIPTLERVCAGVISGLVASGMFQIPKQLQEEAINRVMNSDSKKD